MKVSTVALFLAALFVISVDVTAVSVLSDLDAPSDDIRIHDLTAGNLFPMLTGPTLWNRYPTVPHAFGSLIHAYAFIVVSVLAAVSVFILRNRTNCSWATVGVACFIAGCMLFLDGWLALQFSETPVSQSGPYLAMMLLGVLYGSLAAAMCAAMEVTAVRAMVTNLIGHLRGWGRISKRAASPSA